MKLSGKTALVMGAGSIAPGIGNGKAVALAFAREGAKVLAVDISEEAVLDTQARIRDAGGVCEIAAADVSNEDDVRRAVEKTLFSFGCIDILHNNVGISMWGGIADVAPADWDRVIAANLRGMYLACHFTLPAMKENGGGAIVNVGSTSALRYIGLPQAAYATSKGAIVTMTRVMAAQHGPDRIRANVITPGIIDTPLLRSAAAETLLRIYKTDSIEKVREIRARTVPLGRFGNSEDVANAAVFLASDDASYITGTELVVDGGLTSQSQFPMDLGI
jgi:NAD(P)-dependent dehydrogenase (short-subunit alcohol dehydrogenase family)